MSFHDRSSPDAKIHSKDGYKGQRPSCLPLPPGYTNDDEYVNDLLEFVTGNELFRMLCGGVHVLDFFTLTPSLYDSLFDQDWREWLELHDLDVILDFILREDLRPFQDSRKSPKTWRDKPAPPDSLVSYLAKIRRLKLQRDQLHDLKSDPERADRGDASTIPRSLALGMGKKKIHEVESFAKYVQNLSDHVSVITDLPVSHVVDFGSGQNYLGRTLASKPYNKHVIAVESKHANVERAREMDVSAKLAAKTAPPRNKKKFRKYVEARAEREGREVREVMNEALKEDKIRQKAKRDAYLEEQNATQAVKPEIELSAPSKSDGNIVRAKLDRVTVGAGSIQYVEHRLEDGDLSAVIDEIVDDPPFAISEDGNPRMNDGKQSSRVSGLLDHQKASETSLMVVSIHSCGNLSHHGIRSLTLNHAVTAVAMIGCCYNLVTERLTPSSHSHKLPSLRTLDVVPNGNDCPSETNTKSSRSMGGDPHGFPMSERLCQYPSQEGIGVHLNITARMMALQAPKNWESQGKNTFFRRHFYRALLQRIFVDRGVVAPSTGEDDTQGLGSERPRKYPSAGQSNPATQAVIIGSLRKTAYTSFTSYVRAAVLKLSTPSNHHPTIACTDMAQIIAGKMKGLTDDEITAYETAYAPRMKDLSIVWTLMAYSAQLIEAVIVTDRWLWLREQDEVESCWVENVFDYSQSPRNMVVVGIKKLSGLSATTSG